MIGYCEIGDAMVRGSWGCGLGAERMGMDSCLTTTSCLVGEAPIITKFISIASLSTCEKLKRNRYTVRYKILII